MWEFYDKRQHKKARVLDAAIAGDWTLGNGADYRRMAMKELTFSNLFRDVGVDADAEHELRCFAAQLALEMSPVRYIRNCTVCDGPRDGIEVEFNLCHS